MREAGDLCACKRAAHAQRDEKQKTSEVQFSERARERPADDRDDDDHMRCCHNRSNIRHNYRTFIWSI